MKPEARRLRGLDALRGLAALSVVLYHFTTIYQVHFGPYASPPLFSFINGHFGVELFFCISGFVILGTIERTANLQRFALARFARIYPAYFVCALITLGTLQIANLYFPALSAKAIAINAIMLASFNGTDLIDPSYWTLSYEVLFYAGAAMFWSVLGGRRRLEWLCLAWLGSSLMGHLYPWVGLHHRLSVLLNIQYANLFVAGMMLYCLTQGTRTRLTMPALGAALLLTIFPPEFNRGHISQPAYAGMIVIFCIAIWVISDSGGRFLDLKPLVFLGEISYSLYLVHQVVGFAVIQALLRAGVGTNLAIVFAIFLMIGVAFALRTLVEKPAERWIKNLAKPKAQKTKVPELAAALGR